MNSTTPHEMAFPQLSHEPAGAEKALNMATTRMSRRGMGHLVKRTELEKQRRGWLVTLHVEDGDQRTGRRLRHGESPGAVRHSARG